MITSIAYWHQKRGSTINAHRRYVARRAHVVEGALSKYVNAWRSIARHVAPSTHRRREGAVKEARKAIRARCPAGAELALAAMSSPR